MNRADELRIKLLVKQAVHEELDEFYRRFAILLDGISRKDLTSTTEKILELIDENEMTADEIANKRNTSRTAAVQACKKLYEMGLVEKIRRGKKVYYRKV
ncbi:winged helix-turn-helix domain-containing protein [Candidatus Undinarchaeota archaeon]